jgi:hypothetical protein
MNDSFANSADQIIAPATRAVAVTPDDNAALPGVPKAIYAGSGGTIVMRGTRDASDTVWSHIPAGSVLPFRATHVRATGTSATGILALY